MMAPVEKSRCAQCQRRVAARRFDGKWLCRTCHRISKRLLEREAQFPHCRVCNCPGDIHGQVPDQRRLLPTGICALCASGAACLVAWYELSYQPSWPLLLREAQRLVRMRRV